MLCSEICFTINNNDFMQYASFFLLVRFMDGEFDGHF